MRASRTYYEILGVPPNASPQELKAAHRRLLRQAHPDMGGSAALLDLINEAYDILGDPDRRAQYDSSLRNDREDPASRARRSASAREPQASRESGQAAAEPGLPFDPRPAIRELFETLVGSALLLGIPFALFGHEADPYSDDGFGSHLSLMGWFLVVLMALTGVSLIRSAWDLTHPRRWPTYAWWWEAGPAVAAALPFMPPAPSGQGARIAWHLARGLWAGGAPLAWHLFRAGAAAEKADRQHREWVHNCEALRARARAATPGALCSLERLEDRYLRRRPWGAAHRRSLEERRAMVRTTMAYLVASTRDHGPTFAANATLRAPLHRIGACVASLCLCLGAVILCVALAQGRVQGPASPTAAVADGQPASAFSGGSGNPGDQAVSDLPVQTPVPPNRSTPSPSAVPTARPKAVAPPAPAPMTCSALGRVSGSYVIASELDPETGALTLWPRVTVHNGSRVSVDVTYDGKGEATNPDAPQVPMEMMWGVDDSATTLRPGGSATIDLGHPFGEDLLVIQGAKVTHFGVTATASAEDEGLSGCHIALARR